MLSDCIVQTVTMHHALHSLSTLYIFQSLSTCTRLRATDCTAQSNANAASARNGFAPSVHPPSQIRAYASNTAPHHPYFLPLFSSSSCSSDPSSSNTCAQEMRVIKRAGQISAECFRCARHCHVHICIATHSHMR